MNPIVKILLFAVGARIVLLFLRACGLLPHARPTSRTSTADDFYTSPEWRALRYVALKEYGNTCAACGRGPRDGVKLHVDHIQPRSKRPDLALEIRNLQILCADCNLAKSNRDSIRW